MATTSSGWPYTVSTDTLVGWPALSQTLANKLETDITQLSYPATNAQTGTTYTFVLADSTRLVTASNAGSQTYTIPPQSSVAYKDGTVLRVTSLGAGTVTFAGGVGVTVTNTAGTLSQYQSAVIVRTASNAWTVIPFTGGASLLSDSAISGTTGSPSTATYTSGGINYKTYTFTGAGSFTLSKSGLLDVLIVGAGGGGGGPTGTTNYGGGGGGGAVMERNIYLPSGTCNILIGAGGVGGDSTNKLGRYGNPTAIGVSTYTFVAIGGGGGGGDSAGGYAGGLYGSSGGGSGGGTSTGVGGSALLSGAFGFAGGTNATATSAGSGGGGAGAVGGNQSGTNGGAGGAGISSTLATNVSTFYGGGGGGRGSGTSGSGGSGGGGGGASVAGTANTGGGGGSAASGGSGVVIVRVKA